MEWVHTQANTKPAAIECLHPNTATLGMRAKHLQGSIYMFGMNLILQVCKQIRKHETNKSHRDFSLSKPWLPRMPAPMQSPCIL